MTSKELRKQRRQDEHRIRKEANRTGLLPPVATDKRLNAPQPSEPALAPTAYTERNRQNARLSTGPKTSEGKTAANKNAFRHGLASNLFLVLPWENAADFDVLLDNLRAEHQPATQTEALLVEKMAQHFWLSQRALRLQELCFHRDAPLCDQPKDLALYLRYGTTHDRAFHRCLTELQKLRAAQRKEEAGFERAERLVLVARDNEVSQQRRQAAETRKQELHEARMAVLTSKKCEKEQIRPDKKSPLSASTSSSAAEQPSAPLKSAEVPPYASPQAA